MGLEYNLSDLSTGSESRQSHVEFIRVNLELMLAVAWNGYESEGRGAIVIDVNLSKTSQIGTNPYQHWLNSESYGSYLSLATAKRIATESGYPSPFQGEEKRQINEYKPEKQVVVCFIRSDGGFSSYVVAHPFLTAKQAYAVRRLGFIPQPSPNKLFATSLNPSLIHGFIGLCYSS
jgi:hypothetical protein